MSTDERAARDRVAGPLRVGVARFPGADGAERAYADARDRDPDAPWMRETAFVEVHRNGRIVVRGSVAGHYVDLDGVADAMGPATGTGAVVGAAVGFLLGPPAFAVGVVGGATVGGVVEASHVPDQHASAFDAIRRQVPEGASALVVVSDAATVQAMCEAVTAAAETLHRYPLGPVEEGRLRSALGGAPPSARANPETAG